MNTSNRVDVVIAEVDPEMVDIICGDQGESIEAVDVASDPKRRIIVLAASKKRGHAEAVALGIEPVAIVTPRSLDAARGFIADEIVETPGLTDEERGTLMAEVAPSLATTQQES